MIRTLRLYWLALAALLLLSGCGGGGDDHRNRFDFQIEDSYSRLADAIQRESIGDLMSLVSTSYLQDGVSYDGFRTTFITFFQGYSSVRDDFRINAIGYDDDRNPLYATVNFDQTITGLNLATGIRDTIDSGTREMTWRLENGVWRMFGDQKATAQSLDLNKNPSGLLGSPFPIK